MKKIRYTTTTWEILAEVDRIMAKNSQWQPQQWIRKRRTSLTTIVHPAWRKKND